MAKAKKKKGKESEEKDQEKEGDAPKDDDKKDKPEGEEKEGGEGAETPEGEGEAPKKKSKKNILIIGVGALVLLLIGLGAAYYFGLFSKHEKEATAETGADGKPVEKSIYYTIPEFVVNLNSGKQSTFLKAIIMLEVGHQEDVPLIEANMPRLMDAFNGYLRELRPSDLTGSAGIQRLREELLLRSNKALAPTKINDVLFKEIIVQ